MESRFPSDNSVEELVEARENAGVEQVALNAFQGKSRFSEQQQVSICLSLTLIQNLLLASIDLNAVLKSTLTIMKELIKTSIHAAKFQNLQDE